MRWLERLGLRLWAVVGVILQRHVVLAWVVGLPWMKVELVVERQGYSVLVHKPVLAQCQVTVGW
jgi:hypothetical protein